MSDIQKRVALFPFKDQYSIINHSMLLNNIKISGVIVLPNWYDIVKGSCIESQGIQVLTNDDTALTLFDVLYILPDYSLCFNNYIKEFINAAIKSGKEVKYLEYDIVTETEKISKKDINHILDSKNTLYKINTPIIFNATLIDGYYHSAIDIELAARFRKDNVNVCVITSCPIADLYGFIQFPQKMLNNLTLYNAVALFNEYIKNIEKSFSPDVIIISTNESINPSKFGGKSTSIINYMLVHALDPDYILLNIYGRNELDKIYDSLINEAIMQLSTKVDSVLLSDIVFDVDETKDNEYIFYKGILQDQIDMFQRIKYFSKEIPIIMSYEYDKLYMHILSKITNKDKKMKYIERFI